MIGDTQDFERRLNSVLPRGWFADTSPVASGLLSAFGAAWATVYDLITEVMKLGRLGTISGRFLDLFAEDYFGSTLLRKQAEIDASFAQRVKQELLRPRCTRAALQQALQDITGRSAQIVEPARPADTGGYAIGGVSYGRAGAWGSLKLNHCLFITAFRPQGSGIAQVAGYGTGGPVIYGNMSMVATAVSDLDIFAAAAGVLPLGSVGWLHIE